MSEFWQRPRTLLRWMMTQHCNYGCWYCRQDHARHQTYRGAPGHWTDNAPVNAWCDAIKNHFSQHRLHVHVTGGEPMLDKVNMQQLLWFLENAKFVETVRIDTNGSWNWDIAVTSPSISASSPGLSTT